MAVFEDLSAQAAADGRLRHAVGYLRLAEFFRRRDRRRRWSATADSVLCLTPRSAAAV